MGSEKLEEEERKKWMGMADEELGREDRRSTMKKKQGSSWWGEERKREMWMYHVCMDGYLLFGLQPKVIWPSSISYMYSCRCVDCRV